MATDLPTRFDSTLDLARLPWFEVRGGNRLVVADDARQELGPVIDAHTHLAMGFVRKLRVDLHAETPTTAYYLPLTLPVDLDAYSNTNLDAAALFAMKADVSVLGLTGFGMRTTHTAPNLLRDMRGLGIEQSAEEREGARVAGQGHRRLHFRVRRDDDVRGVERVRVPAEGIED